MKRSVFVALFGVVVAALVAAGGASERTPEVVVERAHPPAISPDADGVHDALAVALRLLPASRGGITSLEFSVYGTSGPYAGELVYRERHGDNRPGIGSALLSIVYAPPVRGTAIPTRLVWDGTFRDAPGDASGRDGERVPDGHYVFQVRVTDRTGVGAATPPLTVTVDTIPPVIDRLAAEHKVFSPNGDGVRDEVTIEQSGSDDARWAGRFLDAAGETVREIVFDGRSPMTFSWDGRLSGGEPAPDGVYRYLLEGTDAAGNRVTSDPIAITLSRVGGDVRIHSDTAVISPNGDGVTDEAAFAVVLTEADGIESWRLAVRGHERPDRVVAERTGLGAPPAQLRFDGAGSDGAILPDGEYLITLEVLYRNGTLTTSEPARLAVDTVPPAGVLAGDTLPLPTGAGQPMVFGGWNRSSVRFTAELEEADWAATLTHDGDPERIVLQGPVPDGTTEAIWDGRDARGVVVPDGMYALRLSAVDAAGNYGVTNEVRVLRDTTPIRARLSADAAAFSPGAGGGRGAVALTVAVEPWAGIDEFELTIASLDGTAVRTFIAFPKGSSLVWDGRDDGGSTVPDGAYRARVEVLHRNGNRAVASAGPVVVDSIAPRIETLAVPYRLFSPDGDGERDSVLVSQQTSSEDAWTGRIIDREDRVVVEFRWRGEAEPFVWDGTDRHGDVVPDGDYTYELSATDLAGNSSVATLALVVDTASLPVSRQPPRLELDVVPVPFTPDGDGVDDTLTFAIGTTSPNPIDRWSLSVVDAFGRVVHAFGGDGAPPQTLSWDGRSRTGEIVQSAQDYLARLRVRDVHGNVGEADARVRVGILVVQEGQLLRIMIPSIGFAASTADLFEVPAAELRRNLETLRSLAEVLRRYPDREILIEGHAAHETWQDGPAKEREQQDELVPLSAARAEEVRRALIILGIDPGRMTTAGVGGARPVVPHDDRDSVWKNRRVEFILEKR